MEEDLRQREKQRELELEREREREQDRERERERERQREREREREMVKAVGTQYLAGLKALTAPPEDRVRPGERLTPKRPGALSDGERTHCLSLYRGAPWNTGLCNEAPTGQRGEALVVKATPAGAGE